ncbi:interleukin-10 [Takifugu rubripes]|uniref:Interleukin family protein n=1 Tax=Takifugu rubripes TaxID=31033 RepID=Q802T4_TAKRU|nr:interleukin-10 [Takifugu rubripes]CAD62446.1 interleukin 10 homologue [Takifugu rubripes]|eukprot:XP_003973743.1 PREDICTED: interleukin-10 isoform X2 [Takifugu rubripes]
MTPGSLLSVLLLLCCACTVWCAALCNNRCCSFVEGFPARLKMLRENYSQIRDYYEANDDLDIVLLDQSIVDTFKTPFACHLMDGILRFYLDSVLPRALATVTAETRNLKPHVESIQQIFDQLKIEVTNCKHYFACKNRFDINVLNSTYTKMEDKGLYKAMGELDLLFNYIENYLASKRRRNVA